MNSLLIPFCCICCDGIPPCLFLGRGREWEELLHAESGLPYYFNRITNETVWERPVGFEKVMGDWIEKMDEEGKLFYVNRVSDCDCALCTVHCGAMAVCVAVAVRVAVCVAVTVLLYWCCHVRG